MSIINRRTVAWSTLGASLLVAAAWCASGSAWQPGQPGLRNPIDQREQMIKELQEIKTLLREQNALLRGLARN